MANSDTGSSDCGVKDTSQSQRDEDRVANRDDNVSRHDLGEDRKDNDEETTEVTELDDGGALCL